MTHRSAPPAIVFLFAFIILGLGMPTAALAQGQGGGRPKSPGQSGTSHGNSGSSSTTSGSGSTSSPAPSAGTTTASAGTTSGTTPIDTTLTPTDIGSAATGFRQFGSWLDDATPMGQGDGYTTFSAGHWTMLGTTQTDIPMMSAGIGLTDRFQASVSVPFYRTSYNGVTSSGLDDVYLSAKYVLADPTLTVSELGFSVSPVVEILNSGSSATGGRVHFAIPFNMEFRRAPYRMYASAGYFTRGSVFSGAAFEYTAANGLVYTGSLTQSHSTKQDVQLDAMGISANRADVSGSIAYPMTNTIVVFGSVGRSLTSLEQGGTKLALTGGVSLRFNAPIGTR